jgi:translation initiation factor 2 alpha subunit (eIF-2alpha)
MQKELYIEKLKNDFTVMYKMLDRKFVEIYGKIVKAFEECVEESEHMKSGFQAYLTRLHYIKSYNA